MFLIFNKILSNEIFVMNCSFREFKISVIFCFDTFQVSQGVSSRISWRRVAISEKKVFLRWKGKKSFSWKEWFLHQDYICTCKVYRTNVYVQIWIWIQIQIYMIQIDEFIQGSLFFRKNRLLYTIILTWDLVVPAHTQISQGRQLKKR